MISTKSRSRRPGAAPLAAAALALAALDAPAQENPGELFRTSGRCIACHKGVFGPDGDDLSIGFDWRASMMANSARDPYFQAAVRREIMDYPNAAADIEGECARCHMPMASVAAAATGEIGQVFANLPVGGAGGEFADLAADGVSCALCHQIQPDGLGEEESFTARFHIAGMASGSSSGAGAGDPNARALFGPFEPDAGGAGIMHSATGFEPRLGEHVTSSGFCASCHTVITRPVRDGGTETAFPEQSPYLEWLASDYAEGGFLERSCQDCHMPEVAEDVPVTMVLGQARPEVSRHVFRGGNFFMLRMLNRFRSELGVTALPQELEIAAARTADHLRTATVELELVGVGVGEGRLEATVLVRNLAGHKFPTAYPSRRAWIRFAVMDADGNRVFESGAFAPDGSVAGDDHDLDGKDFEPHYDMIESSDQVQVYQGVMANAAGEITTGLMSAASWTKDNRILPLGYDAASADSRTRPAGAATDDSDFLPGSDAVRYSVAVNPSSGPFRVEAELWFQPIAYRWAENLAEYDATETDRFVGYYREMAESSALVLARVEGVVRQPEPARKMSM